ncbi:hypothetical protein [Acidithiobacillus ferridurans]|uniref:hypothetical protein n=1 Tax=Acidithiobacillus ferridurans TaxID=1232575 RepID=UPI001C06FFC6|nr:hypothetical protein [Acidithiobacillus ferridurans]MBU2732456.1 hypothetical protein [Acidithiobacillus ferridurans]
MTKKQQYLTQSEVVDFTTFLSDALKNKTSLDHHINIRDHRLPTGMTRGRLQIDSLQEAFENYWWDGERFDANAKKLKKVQKMVRDAIGMESATDGIRHALGALHAVLEWGAGGTGQKLYTSNMEWARNAGDGLIRRLAVGRQVMSDDDPNAAIFDANDGPRMNAGLTKYYSLACDGVVIYDGRVGAALGYLVRKFCVAHRLERVPESISFRWGAQNSSTPGSALNRDPSLGLLNFPRLPAQGKSKWAMWNIRANWIIQAAKEQANADWCRGPDGFRKVEAALFVMGYEIPESVQPQ